MRNLKPKHLRHHLTVIIGIAATGLLATAGVDAPEGKPAEPPAQPTVVTSQRLHVDYANNIGTFEGDVLAIDPQITVRADKMVVHFGGEPDLTGERRGGGIKKIIADGAVVITQGERKATCEHAEYTAEDGKVVLTGNPVVEGPDGTVSGARITFWRGQDKMDVEAGSRLVIYPKDQKKPAAPEPEQPE
jgi:lipopolysaccharide export system protein LptA